MSKSMRDLEHLLKEHNIQSIREHYIQIIRDTELYEKLIKETVTPYKPTFREKWKRFWNHIPDFWDYIRNYKYKEWRYYDEY